MATNTIAFVQAGQSNTNRTLATEGMSAGYIGADGYSLMHLANRSLVDANQAIDVPSITGSFVKNQLLRSVDKHFTIDRYAVDGTPLIQPATGTNNWSSTGVLTAELVQRIEHLKEDLSSADYNATEINIVWGQGEQDGYEISQANPLYSRANYVAEFALFRQTLKNAGVNKIYLWELGARLNGDDEAGYAEIRLAQADIVATHSDVEMFTDIAKSFVPNEMRDGTHYTFEGDQLLGYALSDFYTDIADAPTGMNEDNDNNIIDFTLNPDYSASEHEYTTDAQATFTDNTDNTIPIDGTTNYQPNDIGVRVKATTGGDAKQVSNGIGVLRLWTPADAVGASAWWDFTDESTISDTTGNADSVSDKINSYDLSASGGARPATGTRTFNGLNTLDFNGSGNSMNAPIFPLMKGDKSITAIVVDDDNASASGRRYFTSLATADDRYFMEGSMSYQHSGNYNPVSGTYSQSDHILVGYRDGSNTGVGYTGTYTTASSAFVAPALTEFYLASRSGAGSFYDGAISEMIIIEGYSLDDRQRLESYLGWKYGEQAKIDASNPYKSAPPTANTPI
jgi:hypothetical protein